MRDRERARGGVRAAWRDLFDDSADLSRVLQIRLWQNACGLGSPWRCGSCNWVACWSCRAEFPGFAGEGRASGFGKRQERTVRSPD